MNSKLATFYITKVAFDLTEGAFTKMRTNQLARLPLIDSLLIDSKSYIGILVDEIMNKKLLSLESNTTILEQQIDLLLYHLYGLTYDEVLIVDPQTPITREEYETYDNN